MFEGLAVDVISDILHVLVEEKCLTLLLPTVNFFPETSMKSKFHFLRHYAVTKRFGPLVKTLRSEVKYQYLK